LSWIPSKTPKTALRVIDGGESFLPDWLELLGMLLFIFAHRKKKPDPTPALFDDVPDTGVHEIPVYRPLTAPDESVVTNERLDEILRDAEPVSTLRFPVSGVKPKPVIQKKVEVQVEEDPFPRKISSRALGQFARAYLKARGQLGEYIDRRIEEMLGRRKVSELDYQARLKLRKRMRSDMADDLLRLAKEEGHVFRDTQERVASNIAVLYIGRDPKNSYFLRFDPKTGVVLGFYSAQGFNRHKANRRARKKSRGEGRRMH
jgi:hypothetical protein